VVEDWRTAHVSAEVAATLVFLEKLTLHPDELAQDDARAVLAAGGSREALRGAATVCSLFSMIVRLADSLGWEVPEPERMRERAQAMFEGGYSLAASRAR
jgi:alkylhydroperoxidase family enzyme